MVMKKTKSKRATSSSSSKWLEANGGSSRNLLTATDDTNSSYSNEDGGGQSSSLFSSDLQPEVDILTSSNNNNNERENKLKFEALGLYGRQEEQARLQECLQRLSSNDSEDKNNETKQPPRGTELIFLDGLSGCGKTALALSLRDPILKMGGAFVMGKHDSVMSEQEPYSGIALACQELLEGPVEQLGAERRELQKELAQALDDLALKLLCDLVPSLEHLFPKHNNSGDDDEDDATSMSSTQILESQVDLSSIRPEDRRIRLQLSFQIFIRLVSARFHPLVIFLDDIQWMDASSVELLQVLALNRESQNLMIIGSYRSNEVFAQHTISKSLQYLRERENDHNFTMTELSLQNLSGQEVNQYLMDLFEITDPAETERLAMVCHKRTLGNPFFVETFLKTLEEDNLLTFNEESLKWSWDYSAVEHVSAVTQNVAGLINDRMRRNLNEDMRYLLLVCSCLGNVFHRKTLKIIWLEIMKTSLPKHLLRAAVKQLFLTTIEVDDKLRFCHDAIKEAAVSLISISEYDQMQRDIGTILNKALAEDEKEENIFVLANLLNKGAGKDIEVAKLNLRAAARAKELSAFSSAAAFASHGIKRLPPERWDGRYTLDLSVELYSIGAESERCVGNVMQAKIYCNAILQQPRVSLQQKMRVHRVMIEILEHDNIFAEAVDYCLDALDSVGCSFPRKSLAQGIAALAAAKQAKDEKYIPDANALEKLSLMTEPARCHGMELMHAASSPAFFAGNKMLVFLLCSRRIRWTVKYGLHATSPPAFAVMGGIFMHAFGDWERGQALAYLSLAMLTKLRALGVKVSEPNTHVRVNFFIASWTNPPRLMVKPYQDVYKAALLHGDVDSACRTLVNLAHCLLFAGKELATVAEECGSYLQQIEDFKYDKWAEVFRLVWQTVLNLISSENTTVLTGMVNNEEQFLSDPSDKVQRNHMVHFYRRLLCAFFGEYRQGAEDSIKWGDEFMKMFPGVYFGFDVFYQAVSLYATARATKQRRYRKRAEKLRTMIGVWVKKGAPNHAHQLHILNAEHAALAGATNKTEVVELFEKAIADATRGGFLQNAALAGERFADYLLSVGDQLQAQRQMKEAIDRYSEWGAMRKVEMLKEKHSLS